MRRLASDAGVVATSEALSTTPDFLAERCENLSPPF